MASNTLEFSSALRPADAMDLFVESAKHVQQFDPVSVDPQAGEIKMRRGWGLTNPQDAVITFVRDESTGGCTISITISILALADPIGFTKTSAERFKVAFENHERAKADGTTPEPPPKDNKGMIVLGVSIGMVLLVTFCACGGGILGNL